MEKIQLFNPEWLSYIRLLIFSRFLLKCLKVTVQVCFQPPSLGSPHVCLCTVSQKHTGARRSVQRMDSLMCYVSAVNPQIMRGCWAQLIWFNRSLRLALMEAQAFPRNAGPPASWRSALPPQLTRRQHFRSFFLWRKHLCDNNVLPLNQQSHISSTG